MRSPEDFTWLLDVQEDLNLIAVEAYELLTSRLQDLEIPQADRIFINQNAEGFLFNFSTLRKALAERSRKEQDHWRETFGQDERYWRLVYPYFLMALGIDPESSDEAAA